MSDRRFAILLGKIQTVYYWPCQAKKKKKKKTLLLMILTKLVQRKKASSTSIIEFQLPKDHVDLLQRK